MSEGRTPYWMSWATTAAVTSASGRLDLEVPSDTWPQGEERLERVGEGGRLERVGEGGR